jgi:beta-lactamase regulating signal transducer with metallopeptidase domain
METLRYVLLTNGLLALVAISYFILLRRETFFRANRVALWLGVTAALLIPLLKLPDWRPQPVRNVMQRTAAVIVPKLLPAPQFIRPEITITFPNKHTYRAFHATVPQRLVWSWQSGLILIYLLGIVLSLIRLSIQLFSLRSVIRHSTQEAYDDFILADNNQVHAPFSFFSWVVLNTNLFGPEELDQILRHERVHVRERHSFDILGAELLCIVFWINPTVYLLRSLVRQMIEFSTDSAVLSEGVDAYTYQYSLITLSQSAHYPSFISSFSGPTLRQRIAMINRPRSNSMMRSKYTIWGLLVVMMALGCRHNYDTYNDSQTPSSLPATNASRTLVNTLNSQHIWRTDMLLINDELTTKAFSTDPIILHLKNNRFAVSDDYKYGMDVYINSKPASVSILEKLSPDFVEELVVLHQWDDADKVDPNLKPYQVVIQISPKAIPLDQQRENFFTLLEAAAVTQHPRGETYSFTMNQLLEATFFHNKNALVERTKNEHLKVYDDFKNSVDIFINGIPATADAVETIHVREVARVHTKERPYTDWFHSSTNNSRFELHIQTDPERAKRDSSYYVFSPFYSGDF